MFIRHQMLVETQIHFKPAKTLWSVLDTSHSGLPMLLLRYKPHRRNPPMGHLKQLDVNWNWRQQHEGCFRMQYLLLSIPAKHLYSHYMDTSNRCCHYPHNGNLTIIFIATLLPFIYHQLLSYLHSIIIICITINRFLSPILPGDVLKRSYISLLNKCTLLLSLY